MLDTSITDLRSDTEELRTDIDSLQAQFDNFQKFVNDQFDIIMKLFS